MKWPCLAVGVWLTACISGGQDPLDAARTDATAGPTQPDVGPGTPDALAPTRTDASMAGPDAGLVDDASARDAAPPADAAPPDAAPPDAAPDQDGDGISDAVDNCPAAPNPLQRDADADTLGDACDAGDTDGDGAPDLADPCPGLAEATADADADGIGDACDVCPARPDASQADADADGIGDACEIPNDDDSDGVPDARDSCPHRANGDQADADMDDVGDVCDDCPEVSDPAQEDADGDGMGDACDACPAEAAVAENHTDRDGDGFPTCAGDCDDTNAARSAGLPERCDGIDNDCDGGVDDTFPELGGPCSAGLGECRRQGVVVCGGDFVPACDAVPAAAADEVCDALDNDCDGEADEGLVGCCEPGVSEACGLDVGACVPGERVCQDNRIWSACDGVGPTLEACNAQDDDCDGQTDEGLGVRPCGVGACEHLVEACMAGVGDACDPFAGAAPERCNGLDDDCDGALDNGFDVQSDPLNCGECGHVCAGGPCQRGRCIGETYTIMRCGQTARDLHAFLTGPLARVDVNLLEGCEPTPETDALVVSRAGRPGPDLAAFVRDGGIIVTELGISDEVYNSVFGNRVAQAPRMTGACHDNVAPILIRNADDWFWQQAGLSVTPGGDSGCGFDLSGFPGITPLGSWDAVTISLAYMDLGAGRVWFVESDWQDRDLVFSADSARLMGVMIGWPLVARPTECSDRQDNDADGHVDRADPGCEETVDTSEADPAVVPQCANGVDDDVDGRIDYPDDVACAAAGDVCEADGTVACDGSCVDLMVDDLNCGRCGQRCAAPDHCVFGACVPEAVPAGIQHDVPEASLANWRLCFEDTYADASPQPHLTCDGALVFVGCGRVGANAFALGAYASAAEAFARTSHLDPQQAHAFNGVGWYYEPRWSMGFAPAAAPVSPQSCDNGPGFVAERMCWHMDAAQVTAGYRCGDNALNGDRGWRRVVYTYP